MITDDLFGFAYFNDTLLSLHDLASMTLPEAWSFANPQFPTMNQETPILEKYLRSTFRWLSNCYNWANTQIDRDRFVYVYSTSSCFHTGLLTPFFEGIFALFEQNKRLNTRFDWVFKGFFPESSSRLKHIAPLPQKPVYYTEGGSYHPEWPIRINYGHIIQDEENFSRLPISVQKVNNLPLLLQAAVTYGKTLAYIDPSVVAPQIYGGRIQYLLPICLTDLRYCDLAMTLTPNDGFYTGNTCLTLEMSYHNARMLSRPSAPWLLGLVDKQINPFMFEQLYGVSLTKEYIV